MDLHGSVRVGALKVTIRAAVKKIWEAVHQQQDCIGEKRYRQGAHECAPCLYIDTAD